MVRQNWQKVRKKKKKKKGKNKEKKYKILTNWIETNQKFSKYSQRKLNQIKKKIKI
jgi:hypothetical protein